MNRKKRMIRFALLSVFFTLSMAVTYFAASFASFESSAAENQTAVLEKRLELSLKQTDVTVEQGEEISYMNYIQSALIDGTPAMEYVSWTKADTSVPGEYRVRYVLEADNLNKMHVYLMVTVEKKKTSAAKESKEASEKQKLKEEASVPEEEKQSIQETQNNSSTEKSSEPTQSQKTENAAETQMQQPASSSPQIDAEQSTVDQNEVQKPLPFTKDFLFSEGWNMSNVESACAAAGETSKMSWACIPLTKEDGTYTGMQLQAGY